MERKPTTKPDLKAAIEKLNTNIEKTRSRLIRWFVGIVGSGILINFLLEHFV